MPRDRQDETSELFRLLAHPVRRTALEALGTREQSVGHLADSLDVAPAHLSQQLAILRRSGLVQRRREGSMSFYGVGDRRLLDLLRVADEIVRFPRTAPNEGLDPGERRPLG